MLCMTCFVCLFLFQMFIKAEDWPSSSSEVGDEWRSGGLAQASFIFLPNTTFLFARIFLKKYTSTNNRWRQNIDISLSLSFLLWSYGSWINVLLWHNVQMDVTFVMEATLINNIKSLGSYDFHWKRNQNVQKHKVPSFAMAQVQLTPTQNPQNPSQKASELHQLAFQ